MSAARWLLALAAAIVMGTAQAQPAAPPQAKQETVVELLADINAMAVINLMDLSPQQMSTLVQAIRSYNAVLDNPPADVVAGLERVKANLIAGLGEADAWYEAGASQPATDYDAQLAAARDQAIATVLGTLDANQKDVLASRGTPYELFRRLIWEVGHVREVSDADLQAWGDRVVADLSQPLLQGAQGFMAADQATDLVRQVRQMNPNQWHAAAVQLHGQMVRALPNNVRALLQDPQRIKQRIDRQIIGFLSDSRLPAMLEAAVRMDQTAPQPPPQPQ